MKNTIYENISSNSNEKKQRDKVYFHFVANFACEMKKKNERRRERISFDEMPAGRNTAEHTVRNILLMLHAYVHMLRVIYSVFLG